MTNQLKKAPTKELKFNQREIALLIKCIDQVSQDFWENKNDYTIGDLETSIEIILQITNTPYHESN